MGLRKRPAKPTRADIEPYSAEEQQQFNKKYTEAQLASIHAGDSAIDPEDLKSQATVRRDAWSLKYIDDLSHIEPVIDQPIRAPYSNTDPFAREKTDDEEDDEIMAWLEKTPESELEVDNFKTFSAGVRHTVGKPESEFSPRSSLAPTLFDNNDNFQSHKQKRKPASSSSGGKDNNKPDEEIAPGLLRLMQQTGLDARAIQSLRVKTLVINAVTNQTRLGKIQKDYVLAIAGNGAGMLGLGEGKSEESGEAVQQAHYKAIRNMQPILRYEDRTIYGDVKGKVGATELELFTRPPGPYYSTPRPSPLSPPFNTNNHHHRLRRPRLSLHLGNVPRGRHLRHRRPRHPRPQPHEHRQGRPRGPHEPTPPRRHRPRSRKEDGRCEEGVLRRDGINNSINQSVNFHSFITNPLLQNNRVDTRFHERVDARRLAFQGSQSLGYIPNFFPARQSLQGIRQFGHVV